MALKFFAPLPIGCSMETPIIPKAFGVFRVPLTSTQTIVAEQMSSVRSAGTVGSQVKELMKKMEETQRNIAVYYDKPIKAVAEFNHSVRKLYVMD